MKHVIVSGIQPTGLLHIGNYLGAIKNWLELQNDSQYECYYFVPDLHSLTVEYNPKTKQEQIYQLVGDLLALGIDPKRSHLFIQSEISEHTELAWIFSTLTPMSELNKMTQYKDKSARAPENINVGLFTYPVLMAADILMYKSDVVPVGEDQIQHVELARVVAKKFNNKFGETFPEPKPKLTKIPRVMSLSEPTKKMSKSHGEKTYIGIADEPEVIEAKLRKAITDETGIQNLLGLLELFDDKNTDFQRLTAEFKNDSLKNSELKDVLAKHISNTFTDFRAKREKITHKEIRAVLDEGAAYARTVAQKTIKDVYQKCGLR